MLDTTKAPGQILTGDWDTLRQRLAVAQAALGKSMVRSGENQKRVLKERAKLLAVEHEDKRVAGDSITVVEFLLAQERYAIESSFLREIRPLKDLTPVPGVPGFVLGIINVRGQILSVMDIKKFFELPEKGLTDLNKVMIVQHDTMQLGVLADRIEGIREIPAQDLQPSLPTLTGIRSEYLRGVTKDRLVVLDITRVLVDEKIIVQQ